MDPNSVSNPTALLTLSDSVSVPSSSGRLRSGKVRKGELLYQPCVFLFITDFKSRRVDFRWRVGGQTTQAQADGNSRVDG